MAVLATIPFERRLGDHVALDHIEWWNESSRFVVIKYSRDGEMQEMGLRFDLDKRSYLDDFSDPIVDKALRSTASEVWELVVGTRRHGGQNWDVAASAF